VSKQIIMDWQRGLIPFYELPPEEVKEDDEEEKEETKKQD